MEREKLGASRIGTRMREVARGGRIGKYWGLGKNGGGKIRLGKGLI